MTAVPSMTETVLPGADAPSLRHWIFAAFVVLLVHAAIVVWLLYSRDLRPTGAPPSAIMIELAPVDAAPPSEVPPEATPGPQMREAQPEEVQQPPPIPVPELPAAPKPNAVVMPPQKPQPKPKKIVKEVPKPLVKPAREAPAPRTSAPPHAAAAASTAAAHVANPAAAAAWRSSWAAALSFAKHYPEAARARGEQGTVRLALTIDRGGHVVSARLIGSSGSATLDQAALDMARHASGQPLPAEMGASVTLTVPILYSIR